MEGFELGFYGTWNNLEGFLKNFLRSNFFKNLFIEQKRRISNLIKASIFQFFREFGKFFSGNVLKLFIMRTPNFDYIHSF